MSARVVRLCSAAIVLGLAGFVVLTLLAALAYPGGSYCEPAAERYRFWGNFFCDVTAPITRRGQDNALGAWFALLSFAAFSFAAAPFFWLLGGLLGARTGRLVRSAGVLSALATNVVVWTPSVRFPTLHVVAVFSATIPALIAASAGVAGLLYGHARTIGTPGEKSGNVGLRVSGVLGVLALAAAFTNAVGYAYAVTVAGDCRPWLPLVQKLAGILLVAWMLSLALRGLSAKARR